MNSVVRSMQITVPLVRPIRFHRSQSTSTASQSSTVDPLTLKDSKDSKTASESTLPTPGKTADELASSSKPTYFRITQHRSSIGLPQRYKDTLVTLGLRRRLQTVFIPHSAPAAGKILRVKELVKVQNVAEADVKTKRQMRAERRAVRGYYVKQKFMDGETRSSTSWMDGL